ncbi:hypothetical protein HNP86_001883 [Methanococcus maripaludis]|uniref:Uncharacterized protein n=1 Tax=Methanococcus maripaludis TaxID=39152 RepID=A0A7J9NWT4_METMI|nr:hypothetical protein [Methanococcus maripaludis]MBA2851724.1 hypothetical protein [Methanococcus maripaludis]
MVQTVDVGTVTDTSLNVTDYITLPVDSLTLAITRQSATVHIKITNTDLNVINVDADMLISDFVIALDSKFNHRIDIIGSTDVKLVYSELVIR